MNEQQINEYVSEMSAKLPEALDRLMLKHRDSDDSSLLKKKLQGFTHDMFAFYAAKAILKDSVDQTLDDFLEKSLGFADLIRSSQEYVPGEPFEVLVDKFQKALADCVESGAFERNSDTDVCLSKEWANEVIAAQPQIANE